jgi:hypothetical protein
MYQIQYWLAYEGLQTIDCYSKEEVKEWIDREGYNVYGADGRFEVYWVEVVDVSNW